MHLLCSADIDFEIQTEAGNQTPSARFFHPKFAFHLRIESSQPLMHRNSPVRDRLISDSRRALQFCGDSRPHSLLITRGDIIDRCATLSCSYWIKSFPRRAISAIRKVHPLFCFILFAPNIDG